MCVNCNLSATATAHPAMNHAQERKNYTMTKREFLRFSALGAVTVALVSAGFMPGICSAATPKGDVAKYPSVNYTDTSPHKSAFAQVNGIKLNYLDWGGDAPP